MFKGGELKSCTFSSCSPLWSGWCGSGVRGNGIHKIVVIFSALDWNCPGSAWKLLVRCRRLRPCGGAVALGEGQIFSLIRRLLAVHLVSSALLLGRQFYSFLYQSLKVMVKFCSTFCLHCTAALTDSSLIAPLNCLTYFGHHTFHLHLGLSRWKTKFRLCQGLRIRNGRMGHFTLGFSGGNPLCEEDKRSFFLRFRFWRYGHWVEVLVDDYLPFRWMTLGSQFWLLLLRDGSPVFTHSRDQGEW